jgi:hypothetical protein
VAVPRRPSHNEVSLRVDGGQGNRRCPRAPVWLDEPVTDRAEGIKRLQALILQTVDGARPAIRRHWGCRRCRSKAPTLGRSAALVAIRSPLQIRQRARSS